MQRSLLQLFFFCLILMTYGAAQNNSTITIKMSEGKPAIYTKAQLLARKDLESLTLGGNPAFPGKKESYKAVKLCNLFAGLQINQDTKIDFVGADGYVSAIPAKLLLNCSGNTPVAYIAIEPETKWAPLPHGSGTAGPFDVVWKAPESQQMPQQYWPWQVVQITINQKNVLNNVVPPPVSQDKKILSGYHAFIQNCSVCHTLNGIGSSHLGPDLNTPKSPVEYFKNDAVLKQYIRNPQSLRQYDKDRMPGVGNTMSEDELDNLVTYLRFMSQKR